ncbi:cation transporter [Nitrosomonas ureae]|uniref:Cation efflux family protein n=1 Tax=Nitrosomonas ureae TaxID=44577 RepID=A0A2T5IU06_9PROT|nr:cation transporter [Nitrosomonas ureae]PTQ87330.1 cation efflux family protein [Nitrosomonas ureae]
MSGCGCEMETRNDQERKTLMIVLGINASMFVFEFTLGLLAESTGLIADSLDMFADASVYSISLYAVGKSTILKDRAARLSGVVQIALALLVLIDVLWKFILGSEPISILMMSVGVIALIANSICLLLISKHRGGDIHMRASLIFSKNDVIANVGVIFSGILVWALDSRYPDLVIGLIISVIVLRGGIHILKVAARNDAGLACETNKNN